jgi:hypothetical protein
MPKCSSCDTEVSGRRRHCSVRCQIKANSRVDRKTGCWVWERRKKNAKKGYGAVSANGKAESAHTASYKAFVGAIPDGHVIRHKCHNQACVNPDHLHTGTPKDNVHDAIERGTWTHWSAPPGAEHPAAKLTDADVLAIRADGRSHAALARQYDVSDWTISAIRRRKTWKHI